MQLNNLTKFSLVEYTDFQHCLLKFNLEIVRNVI